MKIVYDENIPCGREAFATLGAVTACAGRAITPALVRDADLLFVRSVTEVNAALLDGSRVRFVATATSGSDHIDKPYLERAGIAYCDAIGSNAVSVAEYITAALFVLSARMQVPLAGRSIAVIGVGHVGRLVVEKARALGMRVLMTDPPRARAEKDFAHVPLDEALRADIITLHTPLTDDGIDATHHLLDGRRLAALTPGAWLLQASRGEVIDTRALGDLLAGGQRLHCVLDVWENEPHADPDLLARTQLATPHIAGYSWPSKINATQIIYEAACRFLGVAPVWQPPRLPEGVSPPSLTLAAQQPLPAQVSAAVTSVYDILADDQRMRALAHKAAAEQGAYFDYLRKTYPVRLEFRHTTVRGVTAAAARVLRELGFTVEASR